MMTVRDEIALELEDLVSRVDNHSDFTALYYRRHADAILALSIEDTGVTVGGAIELILAFEADAKEDEDV